MSIDPNLAGKSFTATQFSLGNTSGTDPITYTETDPGTELGPGTVITVDSVTTTNGVTMISATVSGSTVFGGAANGNANGTVIANDTSSIILNGMLDGQSGTIYFTNNAADQPGVNNSVSVPAAGDDAYVAPCFVSGTLIRTSRGDVAVEALVLGDVVVTASGGHRTIRWLGHRTVDCAKHPRPHEVMPIRIAAHAFGEAKPSRDLYLSPGHPVLVEGDQDGAGRDGAGQDGAGHLVPIMCLINGTTIERVGVDEVTYWHVELDQHDILLAEGLPAESYLDWGDRVFFTENSDHALTNPDFIVPGLAGRCRPVAIAGPVVEAERRRLDMVFATRLADACAWPDEPSLALA